MVTKKVTKILSISLILVILIAATFFILRGTFKTTGKAIDDLNENASYDNLDVEINPELTEISYPALCVTKWSCEDWTRCKYGQQTRTCYDINNCAIPTSDMPSTSQRCSSGGGGGGIIPTPSGLY